jgi:uncharacterized protein DUF4157
MTRWMHPPEAVRARGEDLLDPVAEGARHGLSREVSLAIWERMRADAGDAVARLDAAQTRRRFGELAARVAARGGRIHSDVGRLTRVDAEHGDATWAVWGVDALSATAPGRDTQVASEARQRTRLGGEPAMDREAASAVARPRPTLAPVLREAVMRSAERAKIDPGAAELVKRALRGGMPLDDELRAQLEASLGADLTAVRVHTDGDADTAARALGARAFAIGNDVFFRAGAYDPRQRDGRWLIAHEVAHTVQARTATAQINGETKVSQPGDPLEHEADGFADDFVRGAGDSRAAGADATGLRPGPRAPGGSRPVAGSLGASVVQRFNAKSYEGMDPVDAVGKALDDDKEDDAHELMKKLDATQANKVLQQFQHKATSAFDNDEMGKAAKILVERGGRLDLALEWMFDEGTSWSLLRATVAACTSEADKQRVRTDHFRDLFVGEVNNKEMDQLVDLLGGDIVFKLRWMFEEGTDFKHVKAKIEAVDVGQRKMLQTQAWRDYFVKQFGNDEIAELAQLIGGDLPTKLLWMIDEGTDWDHIKAAIAGAPGEKNKIIDDAWMKRFVKELGNTEMAELVKLLPLDLTKKLLWMKEEGTDWDLMKDVINSVPVAERVKVVENDSVRALFVKELGNDKMYEAVKLLGGKLAKQLLWMADEGCDDAWITERIASQPDATERAAVYGEKLVVERLRDIKADARIQIIKDLGGTPEQQMSVFYDDIPIVKLTWATATADWVAAIMKFRKSPLDLLEIAKGNAAGWGPLIQPKLYDLLKDFEDTLYPEERVKVFWAAYGNGTTFTSPQIMRFIGTLTGKDPVKGGKTLKSTYKTKDPDDATAQEFMNILKPGGSSGATGISRAELAMGELAFCDQKKDDSGAWAPITTSYFHDPYIIIAVNASGHMNTSTISNAADGTPNAVGTSPTALTFFQNHVRHEIGHAVGDTKVGNMSQKGDDFAKQYGGWETSSASDFKDAYWHDVAKPAAGWPSVAISGVNVTLTNDDVKKWCVNLLDDGEEEQNAIGKAPGNIQVKLAAIKGSLWSTVKMVDYLMAIGSTTPTSLRDRAFSFSNFTPTDPVRIYSTRWKDGFAKYSKGAWTAFKGISWYGLSSPAEMFAEMYTAKYAQMTVPAAVNGKDPGAFFTELERQRDPMFGK